MALGESYPAAFIDDSGETRFSGDLQFTDDSDQPEPGGGGGGPANPYAPLTGDDVSVLTDSTGAHVLIDGGDDTTGATLYSIDGLTSLSVFNSGVIVSLDTGDIFTVGTGASISDVGATTVATLHATDAATLDSTLAVTGVASAAAAAATTNLPRLNQLTSALTITSGTLPNTGAWVSGTAKVNPVARQITVNVECVFDGTANAATVAIAISSDDTTYTTVGTPGVSVGVNTTGASTLLVPVNLPAGWFIKLTIAAHASVAASIYY